MINQTPHIPVMLDEMLAAISPQNDKIYVDATFGNGGYTKALLDAAKCQVIAIDRDPNTQSRAEEFKQIYGSRFNFFNGCFGNIEQLIDKPIDGVVFDIGVSSMQVDQKERGFSYNKDAPLDMRMSCNGLSAAYLINNLNEKQLADIIYKYGEEKKSRQIAAKIVQQRKIKPIETTKQLAEIVYQVIFKKNGQPDPAARTFQAIRIAVNDELGELDRGLNGALSCLNYGGRMVVITFHSLEDRIVKNFFNQKSGKKSHVSRYLPDINDNKPNVFSFCSKAIRPSLAEIEANPRAHSAKLRYAIKNDKETK